jgi:hypothetical protein
MPFALVSPMSIGKKRSAGAFRLFSTGKLPRGIPPTTQTSMRQAGPRRGLRKCAAKLTVLPCGAAAVLGHDYPLPKE